MSGIDDTAKTEPLTRSKCLQAFGIEDSEGFDMERVKKSYAALQFRWHPDRNLQDQAFATAKFAELGVMFDFLENIYKARTMDRTHASPPTTPRDRSPPPPTLARQLSRQAGLKLDERSPNGFLKDLPAADMDFINNL